MKLDLKHQTKREEFLRFLLLLCVLVAYFIYLSTKYGASTGAVVSLLTWSFFVLCTPIADGGFIIAMPVRVFMGVRMLYTSSVVTIVAIVANVILINTSPDAYKTTALTSLLYQILTVPWPYWTIPVLCTLGTILSIIFGDEMFDVVSHKDRELHHKHGFKYRILATIAIFAVIVAAYYHLLDTLGVAVPTN